MQPWQGVVVGTTPRLLLRTYRRTDLPAFAALNADPDVVEHLGGRPLTRRNSDRIAEWAEECWATQRLGLLAVERRLDGAFVGMCGLHYEDAYPVDVEIAWRLARQFWGQGYATEAASAWLSYGFGELGLDRIISMAEPANLRSLAVMQRLGMRFDHEAEIEDEGQRFVVAVHLLTADQWRER